MTTVLFAIGLMVVLAFASYMRLPLTSVYMASLAALAFSVRPRPEPLQSVLELLNIPARLIESYGRDFRLTPLATAVICLGLLFVIDIALTTALGWRRK
jgi:hypothetical protein